MLLTTADGVRLAATVLPGPGGLCIVLAHGFGVSRRHVSVIDVARTLSRHGTVISYDARGHGTSSGRSTLGNLEVLDVDAAVAAGRERVGPAGAVATVGFSMGGAAVVRQAALRGTTIGGHLLRHPPDAVVTVSAGSRWSERATATGPLRRLHRMVETRSGRVVTRAVLRTRVASRGSWNPLPPAPLDVVASVAPLPLLIVHGDVDPYFPLFHARDMAAAARPPVELWEEPGFAHAEIAASEDLVDRIGAHLAELARAAHPAERSA